MAEKEKKTPVAGPGRQLFYVKNPIMLGQVKFFVRVIGYDDTKGKTAPYVIGRGHVIDVPTTGVEAALERWSTNKCIEPYNKDRHRDAITDPVQFATFEQIEDEPEPVAASTALSSQSKAIIDPEDPPVLDVQKKKHNQSTTISGAKANY
jgi:hypothetical protein